MIDAALIHYVFLKNFKFPLNYQPSHHSELKGSSILNYYIKVTIILTEPMYSMLPETF